MRIDADIAQIAALIGDPVRAAMLAALLDRTPMSAGQLAFSAKVSPQAASFHLAKLTSASLLKVERQGRNKVYTLANSEVASAIESLGAIASSAHVDHTLPRYFQSNRHQELRFARSCYDHLAGIVGVQFHDALFNAGYLMKTGEREYQLTDKSKQWVENLGLDPTMPTRSPFVRPCLDWSERRPHLAGRLAAQLLNLFLADGWLARIRDTRDLRVTDLGVREFQRQYHFNVSVAMADLRVGANRKSA
jgi:DNA-binding transcriptional ArsR family regulator